MGVLGTHKHRMEKVTTAIKRVYSELIASVGVQVITCNRQEPLKQSIRGLSTIQCCPPLNFS